MSQVDLSLLQNAVGGPAAAIRVRTKLQPAGGSGDKIFPPTYAGGVYATEKRRVDNGEPVDCVLVDSVQSQANRFEEALLFAHDEERLAFPVIGVDFTEHFPDIGLITALEAPHRIADAILRDSQWDGVDFRDTREGKAFEEANIRNATALYQLCPTALIFGMWNSTRLDNRPGEKFARALVSEVIGVNAVSGVKTQSRIDPLQIGKLGLFAKDEEKMEGSQFPSYTANKNEAKKKGGKELNYNPTGQKGKSKTKPS